MRCELNHERERVGTFPDGQSRISKDTSADDIKALPDKGTSRPGLGAGLDYRQKHRNEESQRDGLAGNQICRQPNLV